MGNRNSSSKKKKTGVSSSQAKSNLHGESLADAAAIPSAMDGNGSQSFLTNDFTESQEFTLSSTGIQHPGFIMDPTLSLSKVADNGHPLEVQALATNPEAYNVAKTWADWAQKVLTAGKHSKNGRPVKAPPFPQVYATNTKNSLGFTPPVTIISHATTSGSNAAGSSRIDPKHTCRSGHKHAETSTPSPPNTKDAVTWTKVDISDKATMTPTLAEYEQLRGRSKGILNSRSSSKPGSTSPSTTTTTSSSSSSDSQDQPPPIQNLRKREPNLQQQQRNVHRHHYHHRGGSTNKYQHPQNTKNGGSSSSKGRRRAGGGGRAYSLTDPKVHANVAFENRNSQHLQRHQESFGGSFGGGGGNGGTISGGMHPYGYGGNRGQAYSIPAAGAYNQKNNYTFKEFNATR